MYTPRTHPRKDVADVPVTDDLAAAVGELARQLGRLASAAENLPNAGDAERTREAIADALHAIASAIRGEAGGETGGGFDDADQRD